MNAGPDTPQPEQLGDLLGRLAAAPTGATEAAKSGATPVDIETQIRLFAKALGEDPDELLRLARGKTPLARLVRLILGGQSPAAGVSSDEELYRLDQLVKREGLSGEARRAEVERRRGQITTRDALKKACKRYKAYLESLPPVSTIEEALTQSTSKRLKTRGPKPKKG
jgi:hypothetical protein